MPLNLRKWYRDHIIKKWDEWGVAETEDARDVDNLATGSAVELLEAGAARRASERS